MDKKEFSVFAMALKTYYPKETLLPNQQAMELWYRQLADIPFNVAETALNKWVSLNKWSPSIADIRETAASVTVGEAPDWSEAWEQVLKAISKYGYYQKKEALASLPPLARETTERMGYQNLCMSENQMQDRANFRMIYERMAEREKRAAQIPSQVQNMISQIQTKLIEEGI